MAKRNRKRVIPTAYVGVTATAEDPLDVVLAKEQQKAMRRFIELLPARQKQVMCMFYLWGWKQAKIAKRLGVSQPAVLRLRKTGLKNLRSFLGEGVKKLPITTLIGESLSACGVNAVLESAAADAESEGGEGGFHFIDEVYRAPHRHFVTPFMIANDKQAYLDGCFADERTTIPKGV